MTDVLQIALNQSGGLRFACCFALALAALQALRASRKAFSVVLQVSVLHRPKYWLVAALIAFFPWAFNQQFSGAMEYVEHRYLHPVYLDGHVGEADALEAYEREIRRHTTPAEFDTLKARTEQMAARINSRPAAIYETAWLECGLNPFRVRDDRVAAGWIQFTRAGLSGLGVSLDQVIGYCHDRDISRIMDLTEAYLLRKWERAGRPDMANTIDLYLAVFAPAHIGKEAGAVVYQGLGNPAYDLNSGLDGWRLEAGKIVRGRKDGRITVGEIWLCLERKKRLIL